MRSSCGRRLQGISWEQAWRAVQISPRCSSMISSWRKRACMQPEECFWQRLQHRVGRRSDAIVLGWWRRRCCPRCEEEDEDMHHRVWRCKANTGEIFDKTQHLVYEATQAKDTLECFWLRGLVPRSWTLPGTKLGFWRQFGNGVLTEACTHIFGDGSGTQRDPRIRRVGWSAVIIQGVSNCLGQTLERWKLQSSWHAWWQLRAREATWSTSQTTRSSRKGRMGVGPHRDLDKVATPISGDECLEP